MIRFPGDVDGWLTEREGIALSELASGASVLEIGSYCGRSTICLAQTAKHVLSIDPHDGRETPSPKDTYSEFTANLDRYEVRHVVTAFVGTVEEFEPQRMGLFDLVFIDAAHDVGSVRRNIRQAMKALAPGGVLAFHDYRKYEGEIDGRWDSGVTEAVNELLSAGASLVSRHDTIAVVRPSCEPSRGKEQVICVGMPKRDHWVCQDTQLAMENCVLDGTKWIGMYLPPCSLLNHNFNQYWSEALNARDEHGATHFAMIHNDVCPEHGWASVLLDELTRLDADMVSAVVPIKDHLRTTSTAICQGNPWDRRNLSAQEIAELPETFCGADVGGELLVNTGLWICDLRKAWCDEWCFHSVERIVRRNGRRVPEVLPEDWAFSHWLNEQGAKIYATSKIKLRHVGQSEYPTTWHVARGRIMEAIA